MSEELSEAEEIEEYALDPSSIQTAKVPQTIGDDYDDAT